jgi:hypothetical protein
VRKWEAKAVVAEKEQQALKGKAKLGGSVGIEVYNEDVMVANGQLDLDDWSDEELARGYRRMRTGKWGPAPKYVPREVLQEGYRRIVKKHKDLILGSFVEATKELVDLAKGAESEKVKLAAAKELIDRVMGKVPEKLAISAGDEPWQEFLADSIKPISVVQPFEVYEGEIEEGVVVESRAPVDAPRAARGVAPGAPGRTKRKNVLPAVEYEDFS